MSWILRNTTDVEALDDTIRLAGMIQWFNDGTDVDPSYDLVVSVFEARFDSNGGMYPGSRDRAYDSERAIMWICTLAMRKSEEFADTFLLSRNNMWTAPYLDLDLRHLLPANIGMRSPGSCSVNLLRIDPGHTPSHTRWASNVLLHLTWAN